MTRTSIINQYIRKYNYKSYLEIGVYDGKNFDAVKCDVKHSVDPDPKTRPTHRMTSDVFFHMWGDINYDLIFLDGLHHCDQVIRDIDNALACLSPGGTIIVHDCNPTTEIMQRVPRETGIWTGDVWRAWMHFRKRTDLEMFVYDCDYGVGVIRKGKQTPCITENPTFEQFMQHKQEWLPLVPPAFEECVDVDLKIVESLRGVGYEKQIITRNRLEISIVIPTYEQRGMGGKYLTSLLKSIMQQKGVTYEVCVSDNSEDLDIKWIVESEFTGVRYQHNPTKGVAANTNAAIEMATADKIKIMYQDDLFYHTDALAKFAAALDHSEWVVSGSQIIDGNDNRKGIKKAFFDPKEFNKNYTGMPSVMAMRKSDLRMNTEMSTFIDLDFYHQLHHRYGMPGFIKEPLVCQRYHDASQSRNQEDMRGSESVILKEKYEK